MPEDRAPIPFSPPCIAEEDIEAVVSVLRSGWITSGPVSQEFESQLSLYTGASHTVVLNSATAGLHLALQMAGVGPGDEVVVPAYTYTASASVVSHVGATIRFVDSKLGDCVPSVEALIEAVGPSTKAIIVVDLAGLPFDSRNLMGVLHGKGNISEGLQAELKRPVVIADAAHSLGAQREQLRAGNIADLTSFSFHAVKNLTTCEGGALQLRSGLPVDTEEFVRQIRLLSLHGQSKAALEKLVGNSWEYDIEVLGWKYNMPDVLAALGLSQLRRYDSIVDRRLEIVNRYAQELSGTGITFVSHQQQDLRSSGHLAIASLPIGSTVERNSFIEAMRSAGVATNVHYKPLPSFTGYAKAGFSALEFPNAMNFYSREVTFPLHVALTDDDVERVVKAARECL